ncbi:MAG TPA: hypothetical protein VK666_27715, partial [Chryseolinea sp.]|nr:hypothetical protein [Chryseolinea sp.]
NHQLLGAGNIEYYNATAEKFLADANETFSMIYIDPSRRDNSKRKVFTFTDCSPDVTALSSKIWERTSYLFIKASPLLDIQKALGEVGYVKEIHVVSINNECKELLFLCEKGFIGEPVITTINLAVENNTFIFKLSEESAAVAVFSDPLSYLYEPNASVLKSGAFKLIGKRFGLHKLSTNTHFYTSHEMVEDFPGKAFRIIAQVKPDAKTLTQYFPQKKANVSVRNYPMSVDELKKTTGLLDGGDRFLLGFSGAKKKFLVVAERVR